jgi:hypothetical protein
MNLYMKLICSVFFIFILCILVSCSNEPLEAKTGVISVLVIDNDPEETPVPDVEITITPGGITKKTNANGLCSFEVNPGDYFIDAEVCCIGPGFIHYQEPALVKENETVDIILTACLRCL